VREIDPDLPLDRVQTMEQFFGDSLAPERFRAVLLSLLSGLGLLLSAIGVYGVTARGVAERTREFGIRLALGSSPRGVIRLVVRQALAAVAVGAAAGIGAGWALTAFLRRVFLEMPPDDLAGALVAMALLGAAALAAAIIPAAKLAWLDPVASLRAD
jgi:ABC-type antimicrobial peptide transport system permease subunit